MGVFVVVSGRIENRFADDDEKIWKRKYAQKSFFFQGNSQQLLELYHSRWEKKKYFGYLHCMKEARTMLAARMETNRKMPFASTVDTRRKMSSTIKGRLQVDIDVHSIGK